jgi:hypothetical protein
MSFLGGQSAGLPAYLPVRRVAKLVFAVLDQESITMLVRYLGTEDEDRSLAWQNGGSCSLEPYGTRKTGERPTRNPCGGRLSCIPPCQRTDAR